MAANFESYREIIPAFYSFQKSLQNPPSTPL